MTSSELTGQLRVLGLGSLATQVYAQLLEAGSGTEAELTRALERCKEEITAAATELVEAGLIGPAGADRSTFVPVSPESGLDILTMRRQSALHQARVATLNAYDSFRRSRYRPSGDNLIEVVSGTAVLDRIDQLVNSAQRCIRRLDSPPYHFPGNANPLELEQLAAGIEYRVVYARASLERERYLEENILPCLEAGEQARVLPEVPVKLSLIDNTLAIVAFAIGEADTNNSALIVRQSSLLSALAGLFELAWRHGLTLHRNGSFTERRLTVLERRMLALLAAGVGDDSIARELGVSRRTFFRHLEKLMTSAGATSRFQLALYASHNGWL